MEENEKPITGHDSARPWQSYNTVYTTAKAGMEGVNKEMVQRIVYEMSKGSKYFENEEKKEAYMKMKIDSMRVQLAKLTTTDISHYQKIADKRILELEATRDLSRIWLHVDMDAFYAAVETLCNPSLKGKPMAVGGMSMISTANYEARKFGVRAAMPGFIARKLCPKLVFVPVDFKKYTHYSDLTRKVFQKYDPNFLAASLDEAYLDITNYCNNKSLTAGEVAKELRESVFKETTGLTCSAGIAPNRLLAKICSDINKPNGQFMLPNERMAVMTFISSLPIRKIGGIGKVTEKILTEVLGITTCEEIRQKSSLICALFSHTSADFFLSVGLGLGRTNTPQVTQRKSMSNERTFSPTDDEASLHKNLADLSENLSSDLEKHGLRGRTLTLKTKTSSFEVRTRAVTLPNYICSSEDILKHAMKLFKAEVPVSLRLMGLRMSHFSEGSDGASLDPKQKTLHHFILSENVSVRGLQDEAFSDPNTTNDALAISDSSEPYDEPNDFVETYRFPDLADFGNEAEIREQSDLPVHNFTNTVENHDNGRIPTDLLPDGATRSVELNSFSRLSESSEGRQSSSADENQTNPVFWLHDYQCSVCGIEMPPSFIEERQEHFDFHLAERLQDEESSNGSRILKPMQRFVEKDRTRHSRQRKKQKGSPPECRHVKIDAFFR